VSIWWLCVLCAISCLGFGLYRTFQILAH
jgi:hypothetical protein